MADFDTEIVETTFFTFGLFLVGSYAAVAIFIIGIYVPKLARELEECLDSLTRNWIQIQTITALAYLNLSYTYKIETIIDANHE